MNITILAVDFDGTISQGDDLAPEARDALRRWKETGQSIILVTGRFYDFVCNLQKKEEVFDLIVAENGAILYDTHTDKTELPFGTVPAALVDRLAELDVPLWRGRAITNTHQPHGETARAASRNLGVDVNIEENRDQVMLLPEGASKGAGLTYLLDSRGLSPRNVLAIGDAENDLTLMEVVGARVAVANAVPQLKEAVDYVTSEEGPAGVARFIERYLLDKQDFDFPIRGA